VEAFLKRDYSVVANSRNITKQKSGSIVNTSTTLVGPPSNFLTNDVSTQAGTMALVPQVVDAVKVPVIAAGGIADARGIVAAFALGAAAVQIGTAYLLCPEAKISPVYRQALRNAKDIKQYLQTY
jgi:nitronate monooxygenase